MQARKGNKVYTIDKTEVDAYTSRGFDVYEGGKLKAHAKGKKVSIEEYEKALKRIAELEKELKAAKKG